jgi:antitoxin component of MazEF toxin-antitoxin module
MVSDSEIRKLQGLAGEASLGVTLPARYVRELGMSKGDFVKIRRAGELIVLEKISTEGTRR